MSGPVNQSTDWDSFSGKEVNNKGESIYITTPIYYVNGEPHIGHVYTTLIVDAFSRWGRITGKDVKMLTGTDEHGQKVQQSAEKEGVAPIEFCDRVSAKFRAVSDSFNFQYDDFIRTTEPRHKAAVEKMWELLDKKGDITLDKHEGWYSVSDECFYTELQVEDGKDPKTGEPCKVATESGNSVVWQTEENYKFSLSKYEAPLLEWLNTPGVILPESRRLEIVRFVEGGLWDLSISRLRGTCSWGIPAPADPENHTIYVWLDALTNYLSATGFPDQETPDFKKMWPNAFHVLGKDILKFHAVYWPAFLLSAGLPLPKHLVAHGWWTKDGMKISKTLGNAFDPDDVAKEYSVDALRYFLLRESRLGDDNDYRDELMERRYGDDLAKDIGNMVCRAGSKKINPDLLVPASVESAVTEHEETLRRVFSALPAAVDHAYTVLCSPRTALMRIMEAVGYLNRYTSLAAPWKINSKLAKEAASLSPEEATELKAKVDTIVYHMVEACRIMAIVLAPAMPETADKILKYLGQAAVGSDPEALKWGGTVVGTKVSAESLILFPARYTKSTKGGKGAKGAKAPAAKKKKPASAAEKLDVRVGRVLSVEVASPTEEFPDADRLFVEVVDCGEESGPRVIVSGLVGKVEKDTLEGSLVPVVFNLPTANIKGMDSKGMILVAQSGRGDDMVVELIKVPESAAPGDRVILEGLAAPEDGTALAKNAFDKLSKKFAVDAEGVTTCKQSGKALAFQVASSGEKLTVPTLRGKDVKIK